tara:strand:+ start:258 stop:485 length:228 start_codon:yes stop_codon:yes gene_type:complete
MIEIFIGTEYWTNVITTWESSMLFWDGLTSLTEYTIGTPAYTEQSISSTSFTELSISAPAYTEQSTTSTSYTEIT